MRRLSSTVALLLLLLMSFSIANFGKDFWKAACDQSEHLIAEGSVLISSLTLQTATSKIQISPATAVSRRAISALTSQLSTAMVGTAASRKIHAGRLVQPRRALASLCTLRC